MIRRFGLLLALLVAAGCGGGGGGNSVTPAPTATATPTPTPTPIVATTPSTSVTLTSTISAPVVGQLVTLTANVAVVAPGTGSPTGIVTFADLGVTIAACAAQPISAGVATCTISFAPGTHTVTATYAGSAGFLTSSSLAVTILASTASTSVALASSNSSAILGQSVTLTANISVTSPGAGSPTGAMAFKDSGVAIAGCSAQPVSSAVATCITSSLGTGAHAVTATYGGDANFITSVSTTLTQSVSKATPTVAINATQPGGAGTSVQYSVNVTGVGSATPTGTINIARQSLPATSIATCALAGSGSVATCTTSATVGIGSNVFVATYAGDTNYITATGNSPALNVQSVGARSL